MIVSFAVYNFLNFTQSRLPILGPLPLLSEFCTENPWLFLGLEAFNPTFPLAVQTLIIFYPLWISFLGASERSSFLLLHGNIQFSEYYLFKLAFLPCIFLSALPKTDVSFHGSSLLDALFCSSGLSARTCTSTILLLLLQLRSIIWSQILWYLAFLLPHGITLCIQGLLCFHMKF